MIDLISKLKILYVAAEVSPFAKTGGLADVAGSLPAALALKGHDVRIVMPGYKTINSTMRYVTDFPVKMGDKIKTCIIKEAVSNLPVYFVINYGYYNREEMYCHVDDGERYAFFCNAVVEMLARINFQPDIIHCNDWHTGPICMLVKEKYSNKSFYNYISTVFTIHNLEYKGIFSKKIIDLFNLSEEVLAPDKAEYYDMFSFMKSGIVYADIINTVSNTYAREIQTPEYGEGLDSLLRKRNSDLYGIINGICYEEFNPSTDKRIYKNYNVNTIEIKKENKYFLQKEMNLPVGDMPVMGIVSRLSDQKGLELIIERIDDIMGNNVQLVLLGTGDSFYESVFRDIEGRYPDKMAIFIGFNDVLARKIYAGADIFLMPSRFEPCGLSQIISLRYGTIPIVRATGGLADTIVNYGEDEQNSNGFSFADFTSQALYNAIERALELYNNKPDKWTELKKRAMTQNFSWDRSAEKYEDLYKRILTQKLNQC